MLNWTLAICLWSLVIACKGLVSVEIYSIGLLFLVECKIIADLLALNDGVPKTKDK